MPLEGVKGLGAGAQASAKRRRADRHDHEFLEVHAVVGVVAAVEDVHHRHGQGIGADSAQIRVEGHVRGVGGGPGGGHGDAEDGVGAELALVGRAVQLDHRRSIRPGRAASMPMSFGAISSLTFPTALSTPLPP